MKKIAITLALLFLVVCPTYAQLTSNKMMKIVTRDTSPDVPSTSFGAKAKTLYRMGVTYSRCEEQPDPEHRIHGLMVIAEPKAWMINLFDKTGQLIVDPGPTYVVHMAIIPSSKKEKKSPLGAFEFGREYDFLHQHNAVASQQLLNGKTNDTLSLSAEGYTIVLFSQQGKPQPHRVTVTKGEAIVCQYDYDEYVADLAPQMDLFEPGKDIRITKTVNP